MNADAPKRHDNRERIDLRALGIGLVSSHTEVAGAAEALLRQRYEFADAGSAETLVALGGDGFMLHTLHEMLDQRSPRPVFGMNRGTVGFLMNDWRIDCLAERIAAAKAMEWCLTGRMVGAEEAERAGLVARVVPAGDLERETLALAAKIASFSLPVVMKIKESINRAYEMPLTEGLAFERREFHSTFALADQKEGMRAFVEKRKPAFRHC